MNIKRLSALILAVMMVMCFIPETAFANIEPEEVMRGAAVSAGGSIGTADSIQFSTVYNGSFQYKTSANEHYYKFTTGSQNASYSLLAYYSSVSNGSGSNGLEVGLLDSQNNFISPSSGTSIGNKIPMSNPGVSGCLRFDSLSKNTTYYVYVYNSSSLFNTRNYTFCVNRLSDGKTPAVPFDPAAMQYGTSYNKSFPQETTLMEHYYKFTTGSQKQGYTLSASYTGCSPKEGSNGLTIQLLDSELNRVEPDGNSSFIFMSEPGESYSIKFSSLAVNTTYYVNVYNNESYFNTRSYSLRVNSESGASGVPATGIAIDKQSDMTVDTDGDYVLNLRSGEKRKLTYHFIPQNADAVPTKWDGDNDAVASVAQDGTVTAHSAGSTRIYVHADLGSGWTSSWVKVNVDANYFDIVSVLTVNGSKYEVRKSGQTGKIIVSLLTAKNAKKVTIPSKIKCKDGVSRKVTGIKKGAFKGSKAKTLVLKTGDLKKDRVKNCLKGSKVKTIRVKASKSGSKNKKVIKRYKKYFVKKNSGKKVTVK